MIGLLMALTALAQDPSDCASGGGLPPIAGTSGLSNARAALATNQQTYSAGAFAERRLFADVVQNEDSTDKEFVGATEVNTTFSAALVPVYVSRAGTDPKGCPAELLIGMAPLDLSAQNLGIAYRSGDFGFFYSASVAYGQTAIPNNYLRALIWGFALPGYTTGLTVAAPLVGNYQQQIGASAFSIDWIGGVLYDGPLKLRAGYAGSTGFYANFTEPKSALFASTALRFGGDPVDNLKAGIQRFDPLNLTDSEAARAVGMTSGFYRDLPFGLQQGDPDLAPVNRPFVSRLKTGHLVQEDIAGVLDLRFAYAFAPQVQVSEAIVGVHNPGYVPRAGTDAYSGALVQGGLVTLPTDYGLGVEGGNYLSLRVEGGGSVESDEGNYGFFVRLLLNDAEQLALYPFARNAVSYSFTVRGGF